jgi:hypothetical protein
MIALQLKNIEKFYKKLPSKIYIVKVTTTKGESNINYYQIKPIELPLCFSATN